MDDGLAETLDQCLVRIADGATVDECLAAYPAQQAELELPLRMAVRVRALPQPALPSAARSHLETQVLALAAARRAANPAPSAPQVPPPAPGLDAMLAGVLRALGYGGPLGQPWLRLAAIVMAVVLVLVVSAGALAAARAIIHAIQPQPTLVPTSAPAATALVLESIVLDGPIDQIAQEGWVVGGTTVVLTSTTSIAGAPVVGAIAHVRGAMHDGVLLAQSILIEPLPTPIGTPLFGTPTVTPLFGTPTVTPILTATPALTDTLVPVAAPAPPDTSEQPDQQKQPCQGQQRGRDDKKCDPKPHDNGKPPKPPKK